MHWWCECVNGGRGCGNGCEEGSAVECVVFVVCEFWKKRKKGRERVCCIVKIISVVTKKNIDLFKKKIDYL